MSKYNLPDAINQKEKRRIKEERLDRAFTLYYEGLTDPRVLAETVGVTRDDIRDTFLKAGISFSQRRNRF